MHLTIIIDSKTRTIDVSCILPKTKIRECTVSVQKLRPTRKINPSAT